jgi:exodeoxyribonuclease V alpha subunit
MTIHKTQGSEFLKVLLLLPDAESPLLTRELLYTGVTRARSSVEIWASDAILQTAIEKKTDRSSGLKDALWKRTAGRSEFSGELSKPEKSPPF